MPSRRIGGLEMPDEPTPDEEIPSRRIGGLETPILAPHPPAYPFPPDRRLREIGRRDPGRNCPFPPDRRLRDKEEALKMFAASFPPDRRLRESKRHNL